MKHLLVTVLLTAVTTVASAQLINPNFETGDFTGWTASDGANVYSGDDEGLTGVRQFEGGFYAGLLPHGSIVQTAGIYLRAGQTVSAWMNGAQSGEGSLVLIPDSGPTIQVPWAPFYNPGSDYPVRWNPISFKIQEDGIYAIGASNPGNNEGPFAFLGVDHFTITPVPESSTYGLLAAVLTAAAIMGRRRKPAAVL